MGTGQGLELAEPRVPRVLLQPLSAQTIQQPLPLILRRPLLGGPMQAPAAGHLRQALNPGRPNGHNDELLAPLP
eukprot:5766341-Lingulodinium_polyedra.AAC.1